MRLLAQAEHVRTSGTLGRSASMNRLFDFLVERSLEGDAPKEIEVAQKVFDLSFDTNTALDSTVRVSVHRLRKKLEDLASDGGAERLVLPRGEYRLVLAPIAPTPPDAIAIEPPTPQVAPEPPGKAPRRRASVMVALIMLAFGVAVGWLWPHGGPDWNAASRQPFWRPLANGAGETTVVSGDAYVFGEVDAKGVLQRLISERGIGSREALDRRKMADPAGTSRLVDLNYHRLPEAVAPALVAIAPIVRAAAGARPVSAVTASRLTTDMIGADNIVYVGLLAGLGDLADPLFEASSFMLGAGGEAIVDRASGRAFTSDWADPSEERIFRRDYALVASLPGPAGNRLLVIAGIHDPGLIEAAQIASDGAKLEALAERTGDATAFEALYEVKTFGPSSYSSRLIAAHALRPRGQASARGGGSGR